MPIAGLFLLLASIQAQIIVKGIRKKWNGNNKNCKKETIHDIDVTEEISVEESFVKQNILEKLVPRNHNIIFD